MLRESGFGRALLALLLVVAACCPPAAHGQDGFVVRDIAPGAASAAPRHLTAVGAVAYFVANDGIRGAELWRSDGTEAGTVLVKDINPGAASSAPAALTVLSDTLYFAADDGVHGVELWRSDGTDAGTWMVAELTPETEGVTITEMIVMDGAVYLALRDFSDYPNSAQLWRSDGTAAGTVRLRSVSGSLDEHITDLTPLGGKLYFLETQHGPGSIYDSLWRSDGTAAGTTVLFDNLCGGRYTHGAITRCGALAAAGDALYLARTSNALGGSFTALLATDGAGLTSVGSFNRVGEMRAVGSTLLFAAGPRDTDNVELWRATGPLTPAAQVADIWPGPLGSTPQALTASDGVLYFAADNGVHGRELWRSDGTGAGTRLVADLNPGAHWAAPDGLRAVGGALYVAADDGVHGRELWRHGPSGLELMADVVPGADGSDPAEIVAVGPLVLWRAADHAVGAELRGMLPAAADPYVRLSRADARPGGMAAVRVDLGNDGQLTSGPLSVTLTLPLGLAYAGDTFGVSPMPHGETLTWTLPGAAPGVRRFAVYVRMPDVAIGATFPISLALTAAGDARPGNNQSAVSLRVAHQVALPITHR